MKPRTIPVEAPAVRHGIGLFETMLAVRGRVPFAAAHFARLAATAERLGFPAPESAEFDREARTAAGKAASETEAAVRIQWLAVGDDVDAGSSWQLLASAAPIPASTLARRRYGRAITLPTELSRSLPFAKSTSWLAASVGLRQALAAGTDEALFVDSRGRVLEGTSTNVFAIDGNRLITAPEASVLPGIVRRWVIENAPRVGWRVAERAPTRAQLLAGGFLTGSLTKIAPLRRLDGQRCALPGGPALKMLRQLLERELYES